MRTLAGKPGVSGAVDGTGADARFSNELGFIVMDSAGAFYITDQAGHAIRRMTRDGVVTTFAGKPGTPGNVDGRGTAARFNHPEGIAIDASDNLYVADANNDAIRKVSPDGTVTTFARLRPGIGPTSVALDSGGNLYVGTWNDNVLLRIRPDGKVTTLAGKTGSPGWTDGKGVAARFQVLLGLATDAHGFVYVADVATDYRSASLRKVAPDGTVTTVAVDWAYGMPTTLFIDPSGVLYVTSYNFNSVMKVAPDRKVTLLAGNNGYSFADGPGNVARFSGPIGIATDASGVVYVVDSENNAIRTITCP